MNHLMSLTRNEMKLIKGGNTGICEEGFDSCSCTGSNDQVLGSVCCSDGITALECCQAQYGSATVSGACA